MPRRLIAMYTIIRKNRFEMLKFIGNKHWTCWLVVFYGISTLVGNSISNPIYIWFVNELFVGNISNDPEKNDSAKNWTWNFFIL